MKVGTGTLQETIGVGFREEGALELRSSTEELYFMDPAQKKEEQEKMQQQVISFTWTNYQIVKDSLFYMTTSKWAQEHS